MSNYPTSAPYSTMGGPSGQTWTNPTPSWGNQPSSWGINQPGPSSTWMTSYNQPSGTGGFGGDWMTQPTWTGPPQQQQMMPFGAGNWGPLTNFDFNTEIDRMMKNFEQHWWNMQRTMERQMRQMDRRMGRAFSSELTYQPSRPASMLEHYSLLNPIRIDGEGNRWLNVYFDLRSYKPEEVTVTLDTKNRCINVEASHEVQESKEHYIKRHYSRKVYIPADLKIDLTKIELKSCLTNEGLLCVEAALPKLSLEEARTQSTTGKVVANAPPGAVFPITVKAV